MTIQVQAQINGGAQQTGAVTVAAGDVVQLSLVSAAGAGALLWEIYSHPTDEAGAGYGLSLPSGWTDGADGHSYFYEGTTPPTITIPSAPYWGKVLARCTPGGNALAADESLVLTMLSPLGLEDVAPLETTQADAYRTWMKAFQNDLRILGTWVSVRPERPDQLNDLVCFTLSDAAGTTTISNSGSGTAFSLDTPTGAGSITFGAPQPFGDGALIVGVKYITGTGGQTYQPSVTNFSASCWVMFKKSPALGGANFVSLFGKLNTTDSTFALGFDLNLGEFKCKVGAGGVDTTSTGQPLMVGERHHLAMTYDGSNVRLYQNGVLTQTTAKTGTLDWSNTHNWIVGNAGATGAIMIVSECKFANVVKSLDEIKAEVYQGQGWSS